MLITSPLLSLDDFTGKKFENTEMFGQYPLQVNGFKDLHECLEAAMIEGEIESLHSAENSARSGQEVSVRDSPNNLFNFSCVCSLNWVKYQHHCVYNMSTIFIAASIDISHCQYGESNASQCFPTLSYWATPCVSG